MNIHKPNVLVIAEDTGTQEEFKNILANECEHLIAFNGIDGVAISRMARPAVIFVDRNIAQLHALGVCKSLLSNESVRSIPVIVIADTANVNGELTTLSNFGGVIQRPIQAEQVKSKIQSAVETKAKLETPSRQKPMFKRDEPIRVLSVDDSSVVRKLVTMILTAEGFKVTTAADGLDGINKAKEIKPDIILLDFVMPKMNGFQVCRILQKDERLRQIPVILVTSKGDKVGDKFVTQLGVNGYITKPFQPEELVTKIHQTLETPEEEVPVQEAPQAPSPMPQPTIGAPVKSASPVPSGSPAAQLAQPAADSIKQIVQEEVSRILARDFEERVQKIIKAELGKFVKSLDKRIEKRVIEKMNEYIRRAKKK
jgi:PleD family two-component response regulator